MEIDVIGAPPGVAENTAVPVEFEDRFTVSAAVVGLPYASCSWTVIGPRLAPEDACPDTAFDVMANCATEAAVTLNGTLVTEAVSPTAVRSESVAVSVYPVPSTLTEQLEKVTTPVYTE